jgi:hypothetical protein
VPCVAVSIIVEVNLQKLRQVLYKNVAFLIFRSSRYPIYGTIFPPFGFPLETMNRQLIFFNYSINPRASNNVLIGSSLYKHSIAFGNFQAYEIPSWFINLIQLDCFRLTFQMVVGVLFQAKAPVLLALHLIIFLYWILAVYTYRQASNIWKFRKKQFIN